MEESGYDPSKSVMVSNFSQLPGMTVPQKQPIQESDYEAIKSAMVVQVPSELAPINTTTLAIQESCHNQTKLVMVQ